MPAARLAGNQSPAERRNLFAMTAKLQVKGGWNEVKGKLKQKYGQLTMMIFRSRRGKKMSFWDVCNSDSASPKKNFALRSRNCSQTDCSAFDVGFAFN